MQLKLKSAWALPAIASRLCAPTFQGKPRGHRADLTGGGPGFVLYRARLKLAQGGETTTAANSP